MLAAIHNNGETLVKFIRGCDGYMAHEVAGFTHEYAKELVTMGIATYYGPGKKDLKGKVTKPAVNTITKG